MDAFTGPNDANAVQNVARTLGRGAKFGRQCATGTVCHELCEHAVCGPRRGRRLGVLGAGKAALRRGQIGLLHKAVLTSPLEQALVKDTYVVSCYLSNAHSGGHTFSRRVQLP